MAIIERQCSFNVHEYVKQLSEDLRKIDETVRTNTLQKMKKNKKNYDIRILQNEYKVGDVVYMLRKTDVKKVPDKLCPVWLGPAIVVHRFSSFVYKIRLYQKLHVVNHDWLKPCKGRVPKWIQHAKQTNFWEFKPPDSRKGPHCICRRGYLGELMLCCEICDKWFHGKCIGVSERQFRNRPYYCEVCDGDEEDFRITYRD